MLELTIRGDTQHVPEERAHEAMRRFYLALQSGDDSAKLERLAPEGLVVHRAESGGRDALAELAVRQIQKHDRSRKRHGIELPPPVYAPGTEVIEVGDDSFAVRRRPWAECPPLFESLQTLWRVIRREERYEVMVPLANMQLRPDGALTWRNGSFWPEASALKQLLRFTGVFAGEGAVLATASPSHRAERWAEEHPQMDGTVKMKLRLRRNPLTARFSVFAVVSPTYGTLDVDNLVQPLAGAFDDAGLRGTVFYDSTATNLRLEAMWADEHTGSGEVLQPGLQLKTNDTGSGGVYLYGTAVRQRSLGVVPFIEEPLYQTHHQGDMGRVVVEIQSALPKLRPLFEDYAVQWAQLRQLGMADVFGTTEMVEVLSQVAAETPSTVRRPVLVDLLREAYATEPGASAAHVVMALLRLHKSYRVNQYHREKLEAHARGLVRAYTQAPA